MDEELLRIIDLFDNDEVSATNRNPRVELKRGTALSSQKSVEEYVNIVKNMLEDPTYVPTANINQRETGPLPNLKRAKEIVKNEVGGDVFEQKYNANIAKRKKIKQKKRLDEDPKAKEKELAKKAERRRRRRVEKIGDKTKLTPKEKFLNFQQSLITKQLNEKIRKNPDIILKNAALMEKLGTFVTKDGNIATKKVTLNDIEGRGIFEIEHQRDIYKKGAMKDFPYNRNLILGPYNRSDGFKATAEKFIEKNPKDPKIKEILKKAEELKITLQPDVPAGTFKTKSLGYKQIANPVEKFTDVATKVLPEISKDLGLSSYTKNLEKAKIGLGMKLNAKIPGVTELFEMAKSIPDDIKRAKYLKAGFKTLGIAAAPLVIYDTYNAYKEGKPILETLEQGIIGTDIIGGTKRFLSLTPEEREARSVVKQDALKDLNVDMPMGFGFIEGPDPMSDLTLEEAQAQAAAGDERVKALEAQKNFERATDRSNFFSNIKDKALGIGPDYQLELAGGGIAGLSGGIDEGPQRTSMNPDSQGLRSLKNRVRNL
jgi:hypothetical protein